MSSIEARRRCPHAVFVSGNRAAYADVSAALHRIFAAFTPLVEGIALDEAFLDLTGGLRLFGSGASAAVAIRTRVFDELRLWCSIGVASSKLVAKLASEAAKPAIPGQEGAPLVGASRVATGVVEVDPGDERRFLHPLPVRALWGVGPKTFERLGRFGVTTIGDLATLPEAAVIAALGSAHGAQLHALAQAVDNRPVEPDRLVRSIGHEETFPIDLREIAPLRIEVLRLSDAVATRTRAAGVRGRTVQLKLKLFDFRLLTRSRTIPEPTDTATVICGEAWALLNAPELAGAIAGGVRLLGVSLSNLVEVDAEQLRLFDEHPQSRTAVSAEEDRRLATAIDAIRDRFGAGAVGPATLATGRRLRIKTPGDAPWGPGQAHDR